MDMPAFILSDAEPESPSNTLMPQSTLSRIVDARAAALEKMRRAAEALSEAYAITAEAETLAEQARSGHRAYRGSTREDHAINGLFPGDFDPQASLSAWRTHLDAGIWTRLLLETGLQDVMDRTERDRFEDGLRGEVSEATLENITATLTRLGAEADLMFKRGLARAFSELDRRFRSHDAFRLGSRIIINHAFDDWGHWRWDSSSRKIIADVERAFALLDGKTPRPGYLAQVIDVNRRGGHGPRQSEAETAYFRVRGYKKGTMHLWFTRDDLVTKANLVLAEYYGATLADAATEDDTPEIIRNRSRVPAKDLAFYPTPTAVVDEALRGLYLKPGDRVLEPSAGIGNIVRKLLNKGACVDAIEIHPARASMLQAIGHKDLKVTCANFLRLTPAPVYDHVVMTPPFSGTHWMAHVIHAFDFLKPGGKLVAILPASAEVNETQRHIEFRAWAQKVGGSRYGRLFSDLPAESFAEVGTRIQTVILTLIK